MLAVRLIELNEKIQDKNMSCLVLRFSRKSNKSRVLSWLTGTKHQSLKNKRILSSTYFSRCESKSLKNIAPEPQSIFSKTKNCFPGRSQKSKTPGLSFSSKKNRLSFPPTLSQKKVRTLDLDFVQRKSKVPKETFEYTWSISKWTSDFVWRIITWSVIEITIMSILAHRISYLTHYKSN